MAIEKFPINVSDAQLADLRCRLDATRWPDELENVGWELGSSLSYMKSRDDYRQNRLSRNNSPATGLRAALHWYIDGLAKRSSIEISLTVTPQIFPRLSADIETNHLPRSSGIAHQCILACEQ
jgi:hypothetical protein